MAFSNHRVVSVGLTTATISWDWSGANPSQFVATLIRVSDFDVSTFDVSPGTLRTYQITGLDRGTAYAISLAVGGESSEVTFTTAAPTVDYTAGSPTVSIRGVASEQHEGAAAYRAGTPSLSVVGSRSDGRLGVASFRAGEPSLAVSTDVIEPVLRALVTMTGWTVETQEIVWTGRIDLGTQFAANRNTNLLLQEVRFPRRAGGQVRLRFNGDMTTRMEQGLFTIGSVSAIPIVVQRMLPDTTNPYEWTVTAGNDIIAFANAVAALATPIVHLTMFHDGTPPPPLDLPTLSALSVQVGDEFSYEFPTATGGVAPYEYRLDHVLVGITYNPLTRVLEGTAQADNVGTNTLTFTVSTPTAVLRRRVSLAINPDPRPPFRVEIDWDGDGRFANDYADVTTDLLSVSRLKRGRDFTGQRYGASIAGILSCRLTDDNARYDRFNPFSPLVGKVLPGREVRISQLVAGEYQQEWGGVLDDVQPEQLSGRRIVRMRALGALSLLRDSRINVAMEENITGADAARRILDASGIRTRWIGTLDSDTVLSRWWVRNRTGLDALRILAETLLAVPTEAKDGTITLESRTHREQPSEPVLTLTLLPPGVADTPLTRMRWSDPLQHLATTVIVTLREYQVGESEVVWEWEGEPISLAPNASIILRIPFPAENDPASDLAVDTWDDLQYTANTAEDGTGTDASETVVVSTRDSANLRTVTISNTGSATLYLTDISTTAQVLKQSGNYERQFDAENPIVVSEHPYLASETFITEGEAEVYAQRLLTALSKPLPRATLTYEDSTNLRRPDVSETVVLRDINRTSRYFVESIDHTWRRGDVHHVTLELTERTGLVSAIAPDVTIATVPEGDEETTQRLSAMIAGGIYDAITYLWTVSAGTLDDATLPSPTWTRPAVSEDETVTISVTVSVTGDGSLTADGSEDMSDASEQTVVRDNPDAIAPMVSIEMVPNGGEGTAETLAAMVMGGLYDALAYTWAVSAGTLNDATLASPTWTRPSVNADTDVTIDLRVTARGTGMQARQGSTATADAAQYTARVTNDVLTSDTDTIYQLAASAPDTPTGGMMDAMHLPTGWTRTAPPATTTQDVWRSQRTRNYVNGGFTTAGAWGAPVVHQARAVATSDTDTIYQLSATQPSKPTGGRGNETHTPNGWTRTEPAATFTQDVWRTRRTRNYENGVFRRASVWGAVAIHRARLEETFPDWGAWTEVAGSRGTTWGAWGATSNYRNSCADRERQYSRAGTEAWTEERTRTGTAGTVQRQTRSQTLGVSATEWRAAAESGSWTVWTEVAGSRTTNEGAWTATGTYRGSGASREQQYTRTVSATWTEARTNPCATPNRQTRSQSSSTTETEWRSDPVTEPDWGEWTNYEWVRTEGRYSASGDLISETFWERTFRDGGSSRYAVTTGILQRRTDRNGVENDQTRIRSSGRYRIYGSRDHGRNARWSDFNSREQGLVFLDEGVAQPAIPS